jgi:GNAT superfamily N-acetyltransferase
VQLEDFNFIKLSSDYQIKPFDCEDADLNDFIINDAKPALSHNLAVTYLLEKDDVTVAYYSLLNDKISLKELRTDAFSNLQSLFLNTGFDNLTSYPAVKVGRFAVSCDWKKKGIGSMLFDYIKFLFLDNNRTGCRFITVDAYDQSLEFYEKIGFAYITTKDEGKATRLMYFDLLTIPI